MLNLTDFLTAIKETDMFAIVKVGPFIRAEWELGGLPTWLLRDPKMNLRSNYKPFLDAVEKYYNKLMAVVNKFQFSSNGGSIIASQIENEFGGYGNTINNHNDAEYLKALEKNLRKNGFNELLFTSDTTPTKQDHFQVYNYFLQKNLGK
jgi:beta-galactosidase